MADKFSFFRSFYDAAKMLPEEEQLSFYNGIFAFVFEGTYPDFEGGSAIAFTLARPILEKSLKLSEAGAKGGSKSPKNEPENDVENPDVDNSTDANKQAYKPDSEREQASLQRTRSGLGKEKDKEKKKDMEEESEGKPNPVNFEKGKTRRDDSPPPCPHCQGKTTSVLNRPSQCSGLKDKTLLICTTCGALVNADGTPVNRRRP